ncbi:hypothetical protein DSO57_1027691 [Entomophthora muscae]|uniref:Uncharacterized protein n=1 Tax=Entomophthora muscae TaxID=34485 RepID=A0ACC2RSS2_9FUNG|nr:hypothetical protein DSO57_1027691 [Entomophthora muscae]
MEPATTTDAMSNQMFGVLYITLTGLVDSVVSNSSPWALLGGSLSYVIKLAPILLWESPAVLAVFHPKTPNASTYAWLPDICADFFDKLMSEVAFL